MKEAGLFRKSDAISAIESQLLQLRNNVKNLESNHHYVQSKLRAALDPQANPNILAGIRQKALEAEEAYKQGVEALNAKINEHGHLLQKETDKNHAIISSVGIPGLAGLGYANESFKNQ